MFPETTVWAKKSPSEILNGIQDFCNIEASLKYILLKDVEKLC